MGLASLDRLASVIYVLGGVFTIYVTSFLTLCAVFLVSTFTLRFVILSLSGMPSQHGDGADSSPWRMVRIYSMSQVSRGISPRQGERKRVVTMNNA